MLLAEAVVLAAALMLQFHGMTTSQAMEAYADMRSYSVLCAVTTFGCLLTTLALVVVPKHRWTILEHEGLQVHEPADQFGQGFHL